MTAVKAASFGRRQSGSSRAMALRPAAPRSGGGASGVRDDAPRAASLDEAEFAALARSLSADAARDRESETAQTRDGYVPWSSPAAMLAGLFAAMLQAGVLITKAQGPLEIFPGFSFDAGQSSMATLGIIVVGLMRGLRIAAAALFVSHFGLKLLGRAGPIAYALAGAAVATGIAALLNLRGGIQYPLWSEALTGLAAGYIYRSIAGVRAK